MEVVTDLLPVKRDNPGRLVILISIGMPADRTLSSPKGILKNLCVRVGTLYAPAHFVVIETGTDERASIILRRPFLNTSGAAIYATAAKISFYIEGRKETFSFKNKTTQISEQSRHEPRKRTNTRNINKQMWTETTKMVTAVQGGQDRRLRGCLGLLHKLCSINSTIEQLHKKLEFVEYLFRCSHNSTLFSRTECVELKPFG